MPLRDCFSRPLVGIAVTAKVICRYDLVRKQSIQLLSPLHVLRARQHQDLNLMNVAAGEAIPTIVPLFI